MPIGSPTAMRTAPRRSSDSGYYAVAKHKKMQGLLRSASSPALTPEPAPPLAPEQPRNPIEVLFSILAGSSGVAAPDSPSQFREEAEGALIARRSDPALPRKAWKQNPSRACIDASNIMPMLKVTSRRPWRAPPPGSTRPH